jgi:excisionase family DNA binding protein
VQVNSTIIHGHDMSMNTQLQHTTESDGWLIQIDELAAKLGVSVRHVQSLNASGRLPRPVKLGRSTRWRAEEIQRWLQAGCPARDRWESKQGTCR